MKRIILNWTDFGDFIEILLPSNFSFEQCLVYLNRSDIECLHKVKHRVLYKLVKFYETYTILKISVYEDKMFVTFLSEIPSKEIKKLIVDYLWNMFDLGVDIDKFYKEMQTDKILGPLIDKYKGLRIVKINDIFEGLCWAIIGQQINLKFAYTLKKRLVERYGERLSYGGEEYYIFPGSYTIAGLKIEELKELQFTQRKAEYIIGVAKIFEERNFIKEILDIKNDYKKLHEKLVSIRGIGNWTADYTIMKCFNLNCAFPIADVGIHNALKLILNLNMKPSINEIENMACNWEGWQAYAAFYIWRRLYD